MEPRGGVRWRRRSGGVDVEDPSGGRRRHHVAVVAAVPLRLRSHLNHCSDLSALFFWGVCGDRFGTISGECWVVCGCVFICLVFALSGSVGMGIKTVAGGSVDVGVPGRDRLDEVTSLFA